MRSCFTGREGVIAREIVASRISKPPLRFVLRLRFQKGGGGGGSVFAGHYDNTTNTEDYGIPYCNIGSTQLHIHMFQT